MFGKVHVVENINDFNLVSLCVSIRSCQHFLHDVLPKRNLEFRFLYRFYLQEIECITLETIGNRLVQFKFTRFPFQTMSRCWECPQ